MEKASETIQDTRYKKKKTDQVLEMQETDPRYEYRDSSELTYLVMKQVDHGQCIIENSRTVTTLCLRMDNVDRTWPKMSIGIELAKKIKWVEWGGHGYMWDII